MGTNEASPRETTVEGDLSQAYSELCDQLGPPLLVSVGPQGNPHCSFVSVSWSPDATLVIDPAPRGWPAADAAGHRTVSLVWPPAARGDYSLIVDGTATALDGGGTDLLRLSPAKAVLHRRIPAPEGVTSQCGWDCVPIPVAKPA